MTIKRISKGLQTFAYMEFCHVRTIKIILFFVLFLGILSELKSQTADELFYQACTYTIEGKYSKAISFYDKTIKADPQYWYAYLNRASVYTLKGNYKKAIADLDIFLEYDAESPGALESRGIMYFEIGQYEKAIDDITKALEQNEENYYLNFYLGVCKYKLGDYKNALIYLEILIQDGQESADNWENYYYVALCYSNIESMETKACDFSKLALDKLESLEKQEIKFHKKELKTLKKFISDC